MSLTGNRRAHVGRSEAGAQSSQHKHVGQSAVVQGWERCGGEV